VFKRMDNTQEEGGMGREINASGENRWFWSNNHQLITGGIAYVRKII